MYGSLVGAPQTQSASNKLRRTSRNHRQIIGSNQFSFSNKEGSGTNEDGDIYYTPKLKRKLERQERLNRGLYSSDYQQTTGGIQSSGDKEEGKKMQESMQGVTRNNVASQKKQNTFGFDQLKLEDLLNS